MSDQDPLPPHLDDYDDDDGDGDGDGDEPLDLSNFGLVLERIAAVFKSEKQDGAAVQEKRDDEERMSRLRSDADSWTGRFIGWRMSSIAITNPEAHRKWEEELRADIERLMRDAQLVVGGPFEVASTIVATTRWRPGP